MKIRYRDSNGHFISKAQASHRRHVSSEVYEGKTNKIVGKTVKGYYTDVKKLARKSVPALRTRTPTTYTPREKPLRTVYVEPEEFEDEPDEEDVEEFEDEWLSEYEDDFGDLDSMDELDEILDDEDEWYHNE